MLNKFAPEKARNLLTIILHIIYSDSKVTREDLAELCEISIPSLDRCLSDLRVMNFDIHSFANEGVVILNEIEENIFKTIANEYLISRFSLPIINSSFDFNDLPKILGDKLILKFLHAYANKLLVNLTLKNNMNETRIISSDPLDIFKNNYTFYFMYGKDSHVYICSFDNLIKLQLTNDTSENTYGDKVKTEREEFIEENTRGEKLIENDTSENTYGDKVKTEKEEFIQREIKKKDYKIITRLKPSDIKVQRMPIFYDSEKEEKLKLERQRSIEEGEKRFRKIIEEENRYREVIRKEREANRSVIDNVFKQFLDKK